MFIGQNRSGSVESEGIEGEDNIFLENVNTWSSVVSFAATRAGVTQRFPGSVA